MIRAGAYLLLIASPALALEWVVDASAGIRSTGTVDIAALADSKDYGAADDSGPAHLGLLLTGGVRAFDRVEVLLSAGIAIGGIALDAMETRYFETEPQPIGSTATVELNGALMWSVAPAPRWRLLAGLSGGLHSMNASSRAGGARVTSVRSGVAAAARIPMLPDATRAAGHLQLWADYSLHLPTLVRVRSGETTLFESGDPVGSFTSLAVLVGYGLTFK